MNHQAHALLWALWTCFLSTNTAISTEKLLVCAPHSGCIQGTYMPGFQTARFEAFLGIPYARPPTGELRLRNPEIMPKWRGTYNATAAKPDCIQKNYLLPTPSVYGEEDCLYLNVYRPQHRSKQKLPVMVYIHGGGFFSGSAGPLVTGPEYFMDNEQVILVTLAYRLGALGFLSTGDSFMPGNFGLKDQNLALQWVKRNIDAFGGDPQRVTIFGQSTGAISTHMHILSPKSRGLFQNAISMSGTANVPFAIESQPLEQARQAAELCDIKGASWLSSAKLARALRKVDVRTLIDAGDGLKFWDVDHLTNYRPVVELEGPDSFLSEHPETLMAKGSYMKVPWLLGTLPGEGAVRAVNIMENKTLREDFNADFDAMLEEFLEFPSVFTKAQLKPKMKLIMEEYLQDKHELNEETIWGFMDIISDRGFKQPLYNAVREHVSSLDPKNPPIYIYSFNYSGPHSFTQIYTSVKPARNYGVVHCDSLIYLFRSPMLFPDFGRHSTDAQAIQTIVDYFVHFAKYGEPKIVEPLTPCTENFFKLRPTGFCEYQEFTNSEAGVELKISKKFPVARAKLWNNILGEARANSNPNPAC
ncbi:venom carboxylesterase-6 [Scaptodrosophila lebanonensis]|uniref:Carboxylic ester hydrolase n=1 Tax=Drosophila lebanonensis TaxID=7225 RepID=A0A6J2SYK5_DROLE|nr:venom carboxylesterase-6 [Scaptodrosophila lebanonensis]XP_030369004.1 venom carboxylesterase-6 [Scaptodrosophila lebanonensis]XP_030369005.1 venom carboxylesterase-6 [Scaptodrosophila lebanonensis]